MELEGKIDTDFSARVISNDGTPIAYYRSGTGPPLVLVHGAGASPINWTVFPALTQHFTVYAVDRRGHGESGDSPIYTIKRKFEDIAAVVDSIEEPAYLLGHYSMVAVPWKLRCFHGTYASEMEPDTGRMVEKPIKKYIITWRIFYVD